MDQFHAVKTRVYLHPMTRIHMGQVKNGFIFNSYGSKNFFPYYLTPYESSKNKAISYISIGAVMGPRRCARLIIERNKFISLCCDTYVCLIGLALNK